MRIAVLADVHANRAALQSVLADLDGRMVEHVAVAGDLVGYGPDPDGCVALLAERGALCIAGNHDLRVLDRLPPTRFSPMALRSLQLTCGRLGSDTKAFLASMPLVRSVSGLVLAHGSPSDPEEYVHSEDRAAEILATLDTREPGAWLQVLGHTHRPWSYQPTVDVGPRPAPRLLNPGSVGQSRLRERVPLARYALVDEEARSVELHAVRYDADVTRAELRRLGLPSSCLHCPPRRLRHLRRLARRGLDIAAAARTPRREGPAQS